MVCESAWRARSGSDSGHRIPSTRSRLSPGPRSPDGPEAAPPPSPEASNASSARPRGRAPESEPAPGFSIHSPPKVRSRKEMIRGDSLVTARDDSVLTTFDEVRAPDSTPGLSARQEEE